METVKVRTDIDFEKKILLCIFWTARKTSTTEGCAPFYIKKIATPHNNYAQKDKEILKFSSNIISEIQEDSGFFKPTGIEIHVGEEVLTTYFEDETFFISAKKNKELEEEIVDKLGAELEKKHPRTCPQFISRIYKY